VSCGAAVKLSDLHTDLRSEGHREIEEIWTRPYAMLTCACSTGPQVFVGTSTHV
jgi:hypothetical protein